MAESYAPLLVYAALLTLIGGGVLALTHLVPRALGVGRRTRVKGEAYECGVPSLTEGARGRFSVRYYLVAILFILFDIETVFLIPWAASYRSEPDRALRFASFVEVLIFIGVLVLAYVYVWKRGALDWE